MYLRLRKKGWSGKELDRLRKVEQAAALKRSPLLRFLDAYIFWFVVSGAILVNFSVGLVLVPFLLALSRTQLFFVVLLIGLCFGFLFENLLSHFEGLSHHHYIALVGVVPAIAALSMFVFSELANFLILLLGLPNLQHNSLLIGLVYGLSFIAPFAVKRSLRH
jgi:hypothetical protein